MLHCTAMTEPTYSRGDAVPRDLASIDWSRWIATDRATLMFVIEDGRVLLIRKKRGLGAGKINGPGGRLENGESKLEGAIRETIEEVGVEPLGAREHGELKFQFTDGYSLHCYVFRASRCRGEPIETDEARPIWTPTTRIPFDEMWADDRIWLPSLLRGDRFTGRFVFDGEIMLDHCVELLDGQAPEES